jgi:hypothetical protein
MLRPHTTLPPLPSPRPDARNRSESQTAPRDLIDKTAAEELIPFSPEWLAREQAIDDKLKKSIIICRAC